MPRRHNTTERRIKEDRMNNDNGINTNNKENITQERLIGFASSQGDELLKALKDRFDLCALCAHENGDSVKVLIKP